MKKKLMVLGASFPQARLIEAAKELGYHTIVTSIPGNYPAFEVADEIAYADISNPQEVLQAAIDTHADGIATCCLDTGIKALGYVCDHLHFPGLTEAAAICCNDKYSMKKAFQKANVNSAQFFDIKTKDDLLAARDKLGYPVVLKALDLQGSKGVFICGSDDELLRAFEEVKTQSRMDSYLLEEFLSGYELGAQAFVYDGEIVYILPHGDYTYMSKTAIPVGHYVPLDIAPDLMQSVMVECEKAIRALNLNNCAVNIDLIEKDGKIYLIELTGRAGATCLPELVSIYYGLDYYKMIAMTAMGEDPRPFFAAGDHKHIANASHMLYSERTGTVTAIRGSDDYRNDPDVYDLSLLIHEGDTVQKFTSAKDRIGQVIVQGGSYAACKEKLDRIMSHVQIDVNEN